MCLSVTCQYCIVTTARIELVFCRTGFPQLILYCVFRNYGRPVSMLLLELCPKLWTLKICPRHLHGRKVRYISGCRHLATVDVARCCQQSTDDRHAPKRPAVRIQRDGRLDLTEATSRRSSASAERVVHTCLMACNCSEPTGSSSSLLSSVCDDVSVLCAHSECRRHVSVRSALEFLCNSSSLAGRQQLTRR